MTNREKKVLLVGVVIATLVLSVIIMHGLYAPQVFSPAHRSLYINRSLTPDDIQGWMTFDYINFVFNLPPDYLRETLSIEDSKYPRVTLGRYASKTGINVAVLIQNIQKATQQYKSSL